MIKAGDVIVLTAEGFPRVLEPRIGLTFIVDSVTKGLHGPVAHVRDYRYSSSTNAYCIWSIPSYGYVLLEGKE